MPIIGKIGAISPLAVAIPLARENAFAADTFEAPAQTADASEKVNETEPGTIVIPSLGVQLSKKVNRSLKWGPSLFQERQLPLAVSKPSSSLSD